MSFPVQYHLLPCFYSHVYYQGILSICKHFPNFTSHVITIPQGEGTVKPNLCGSTLLFLIPHMYSVYLLSVDQHWIQLHCLELPPGNGKSSAAPVNNIAELWSAKRSCTGDPLKLKGNSGTKGEILPMIKEHQASKNWVCGCWWWAVAVCWVGSGLAKTFLTHHHHKIWWSQTTYEKCCFMLKSLDYEFYLDLRWPRGGNQGDVACRKRAPCSNKKKPMRSNSTPFL